MPGIAGADQEWGQAEQRGGSASAHGGYGSHVVIATQAPPPIMSLRPNELREWLDARGQPAFRAKQVRGWLARGAPSFEAMHDLPAELRSELAAGFRLSSLDPVAESEADRGQTTKLLYRLDGGYTVEPMANYAPVVESIRLLADPELLGISPRRVVVSTAGLVPRIAQLAEEKLPVTLAISLHAARDELRDYLVPINRRYPLAELVEAARDFARRTGRRVSYEWVVLAGVNDTDRDADELGRLLDPYLSHVNLIPWNPIEETEFKGPTRQSLARFADRIRSRGLNVTVRDTRGRDADAACGQLRARVLKGEGRNAEAAAPGFSVDA